MYTERRCSKASLFIRSSSLALLVFGTDTHALTHTHTHWSQPQTKRTGRCPYCRLTINYPMCVYCQEKKRVGSWRGGKAVATYWSAWWSCRPGLTRWPRVTLNIPTNAHKHTHTDYIWNTNVQFLLITFFFIKQRGIGVDFCCTTNLKPHLQCC